jgi:alginate O-acetyltransferase complex protein AlgI
LYRVLGVDEHSEIRNVVGVAITFVLSCIAWVIFRSRSVFDAWHILTHFWLGWDIASIRTEQFPLRQMPAAVLSIVFLELIQWMHGRLSLTEVLSRRPILFRWPVYIGAVLVVALFGIYRKSQFIYFQF